MTREEQIVKAAKDAEKQMGFGEGIPSYYGIGFLEGAVWADEHPINYDGKAMLYVLNKGAAMGRREMLDKVCQYLFENYHGEKLSLRMIEDLRKAMEEQQ